MATDFLSLLTAIPSLMQDFGGGTSAPYLKQQKQLADQQAQISQALTQGPSNPLYQQMYGQYKQQGQNQLGQGIAELQAQNRLNTNMGRTPLFNQERGGEQMFRNLMQGYQSVGTQADQQTRGNLMNASQATNAGLGAYGNTSRFAQNANSEQLTGYNTIYNLLNGSYKSPSQNTGQMQTPMQPNNGQQMSGAMPQNYMQQMMQPQGQSGSMGAGNYGMNNNMNYGSQMPPWISYGQ